MAEVCRQYPAPACKAAEQSHYWLIGLLAFWVASAGTWQIPLNGHEVFVAETAREMQERGNWLIPYYNGELRLNKPPLSYWFTGAIAWLAGQQLIQDWHARAVSALAATGVALLTLWLGRLLYTDRRVALLASLFVVSSLGFFTYSHDARPDMLYTLCCCTGYSAFVCAWRRREGDDPTALPIYAMWLAYAFATLAKGPHVPAILLGGCAGFLRWHGQRWRAVLDLLRPISGLLLLAAFAAPWWLWLRHEIGADTLGHSQLGGALLTLDWRQLLNPYHLLRILQLALPWSLLLPFAGVLAWRRRRFTKETFWLVMLILLAAFVLGFGSQRRWFYMLPLLPLLCLLTAELITRLHSEDASSGRLLANVNAVLWLCLALCGFYLFKRPGCCGDGQWPHLLAGLGAAWTWVLLLGWHRWKRGKVWREQLGSPIAMALVWGLLAASPALWSLDRFYTKAVSVAALANLPADTPAVMLDDSPMAFTFYLRRTVASVPTLEQLEGFSPAGTPILAIVDTRRLSEIPVSWTPQILAAMPKDAEQPKTLLLLQPTH